MCRNFGTPKIINYTFGTNGKFIAFTGVPILKQIEVVLHQHMADFPHDPMLPL